MAIKFSGATSGSLAASIDSDPCQLADRVNGFALQAITTSTAVGTLKLQASAKSSEPTSAADWSDIADSSKAVSAAGTYAWSVSDAYYRWIRVVYTRTSGTGTITCYLST